jgi:hypothetical protein
MVMMMMIMMMMITAAMEDWLILFAAHNPHGKAKEFFRKLSATWTIPLTNVHQICPRLKKLKSMVLEGRKMINISLLPSLATLRHPPAHAFTVV